MTTFASTPSTAAEPGFSTSGSGYLHVAAAVIRAGDNRILIARRPQHLHQGGLWEFPGGKVEAGETVREALVRELAEEVGIDVLSATPLIQVPHAYPDRQVLLDVWEVNAFSGVAHGKEGQDVCWATEEQLPEFSFPAANLPIVNACRLPDRYLVTPDPGDPADWPGFLDRLERRLMEGVGMVQLRAPALSDENYRRLAVAAIARVQRIGGRILLNASPELALALGADGVHLNARRLANLSQRPLPAAKWVAASCHDEVELRMAVELGADFTVLSPVCATPTHPTTKALGWQRFAELVAPCPMPVYALGGVDVDDIGRSRIHGAQGIAAIRALWTDGSSPC